MIAPSRSLFWKLFIPVSVLLLASALAAALFLPVAIQRNAEQEAVSVSDNQKTLKLETLIQTALQKNPSIMAAHADWMASKKNVWIDTALPDPMIGYDIMGAMRETRVGPESQRFMVSQEIPFPLKLWEQGKIAGDEARAAYYQYLGVQRDMVQEMTKLYYELYYVDASLAALEEIKEVLKKFEGVAEARYANLSGTQRDAAKAQAEVSMSLEKKYSLEAERESLIAMLNALCDQDPMNSLDSPELPDKPVLQHSLIELVNLAIQNREEIKEMEAMLKKSSHEKVLAHLNNIPDLNIGFEYDKVDSGMTAEEDDGKDSWMFPLRINVPLWQQKNFAMIKKAGAEQKSREAKLIEAKNKTYYEVKDAYYKFQSAMKTAELYETAVIPQAQIALNSDLAGYESGKSSFLDLLDSERVYLNAKLTYVRLFTEGLKSHVDLVRATGLDFERKEESK